MRELLHESLRLVGACVCAVATARDAVARMSPDDIIVTDVGVSG
jgi:hypothetical protein